MYTAQFVEQFDALFNTFNSQSLKVHKGLDMLLIIQVVTMYSLEKPRFPQQNEDYLRQRTPLYLWMENKY